MIFVIILLTFASVQAIENVLLDSTTDHSSGWLLYSRTLQPPTIEGWKAVQDKNNLTSYEVCDRQPAPRTPGFRPVHRSTGMLKLQSTALSLPVAPGAAHSSTQRLQIKKQ